MSERRGPPQAQSLVQKALTLDASGTYRRSPEDDSLDEGLYGFKQVGGREEILWITATEFGMLGEPKEIIYEGKVNVPEKKE